MNTRKRLIFDIETSPNIVMAFQVGYQIDIPATNILVERAIICICYKFEGEKKVHHLTWDKKQCDKAMLQKFMKIMNEADECVAHNGDNFDIKWLRTRCLYHKISAFPEYVSIDTKKEGKKYFLFNSNALDYISWYIGGQRKKKVDMDLWKAIAVNKSAKAMKEMVEYCKVDVLALEEIFLRFKPYTKAKTSIARIASHCPECDSPNTQIAKHRPTASGTKRVQFQCQDCGKYHTISTKRYLKEK